MNNQQLGILIRQKRREKCITQFELGQIVGLHQSAIANIERGMPYKRHDVIDHICDILEIDYQRPPELILPPDINRRIAALRQMRRLDDEDFAMLMNCSKAQINKIERGKIKPSAEFMKNFNAVMFPPPGWLEGPINYKYDYMISMILNFGTRLMQLPEHRAGPIKSAIDKAWYAEHKG